MSLPSQRSANLANAEENAEHRSVNQLCPWRRNVGFDGALNLKEKDA